MSDSSKIEKIEKVNKLFDQFVGHIADVRENIDKQSIYSEGYNQCLIDIVSAINNNDESKIIESIKSKIDMQSRSEVLTEISEGLQNLNKAYKRILLED